MLLWLSQVTGLHLWPQRNKPGSFDQQPRTTQRKKGVLPKKEAPFPEEEKDVGGGQTKVTSVYVGVSGTE